MDCILIEPTDRKPKKNMIVTQSNRLIEARYTLSLYEQRLVLMMIAMVEPEDADFKNYIIKISDFGELLGLKNKNIYTQIKKILLKLRERTLLIPKGKKDFLITGWISSAEYVSSQGVVKLSFDAKLKPYLLALKSEFTKQKLGEVVKFKGVYTIRIYGLLKQYERIGFREFSIEEFRKVLGIGDSQYVLFADLKRRTIIQAQKEFSKVDEGDCFLSDINFNLETKKTGRKISHLKFIIKKQKTAPVKQLKIEIPPEENHQNTTEYKAMLLLAISEKHALAFMEQYGAEYIAEKLQVLAERQQIEDVISPSGLFINALKEDRKSEKLAKQKKEQERRAKEDEKRRLEAMKRQKEELAYEFGRVARKSFLESLNQIEENKILEEIKKQHEGDFFTLGEINKHGLSSMIISGEIIRRIPDFEGKRDTYIKNNLEN